VKASSDPEDSNAFFCLKRGTLTFEDFDKNAIFPFPEEIFWQFSNKYFSRFSVSFFETFFGLDYV